MRRTVLTLLWLVALPQAARADGMMYSEVGGEVSVKATAQRAVLWLRNGTWEVHIQPVFSREQGEAAWVVPFPVQPTVDESDADFFDQLELITSPVFIRYCVDDSGGGGCGAADMGDNSGGDNRGGDSYVRVWEKGEVGQIQYVIVTSSDGTALATWLDANGYEIPSGAQAVFTELETEDVFFFAGRVSETLDPAKPLAPVRFILPELTTPTYPLRMTGLGMDPGDALDLTLWVVYPYDINYSSAWVPESHPMGALSGTYTSREEYDTAVETFFSNQADDTLLLKANVTLGDYSTTLPNYQFCEMGWRCATMNDLGLAQPAWTSEMMEMSDTQVTVLRIEARLSGAALKARDFRLRVGSPSELPHANNVYWYSVGECTRGISCSVAGEAGGLFLILGLVGILLWLFGPRRRAR